MISRESKMKILLVEDDINLGFLLMDSLESNGFEVKLYKDGESGYKGFQLTGFNLCILDVMLPKMDGFTLVEKIKETDPDIPIIILSARSMKEDKIKGFRLGVDDYVTKPFDIDELVCRINAILARSGQNNTDTLNRQVISIGKFEFDELNQLLSINGTAQRLTIKESRILSVLGRSVNTIVKREEIMMKVWGNTDYYTSRSLDVFISKLRSYLKNDTSVRITTIPTVGYILEDTK